MSRIRIYIKPEKISESIIITDKEIVHKLRNVLRLKPERTVYVFDGAGSEYLCKTEELTKVKICLKKEKLFRKAPEPIQKLTLAFPLIKEEKVDYILQKATELGASGYIPYTCQRSLKNKLSDVKSKRWMRIIIESVRQSEQLWIPKVMPLASFKELLEVDYEHKLTAAINGVDIKDIQPGPKSDVLVVVGPTGDFSDSEYQQLAAGGFKFLKLSSNLLRSETAAAFCVGLINYYR